ncbi:uncharacterized protein METZ01_LOCUS286856, partial [marine metagenome]
MFMQHILIVTRLRWNTLTNKLMKKSLSLLIAAAFTLAAAENTSNWPQWRGPNGDGTAANEKAPTTWSETKNLKWKLKLPGYGASSPIIWNDRVYLTCY